MLIHICMYKCIQGVVTTVIRLVRAWSALIHPYVAPRARCRGDGRVGTPPPQLTHTHIHIYTLSLTHTHAHTHTYTHAHALSYIHESKEEDSST